MRSVLRRILSPHLLWLLVPASPMHAESVPVPNASFEAGATAPEAWTPASDSTNAAWDSSGHTGRRSVSVTGTPADGASYWQNSTVPLAAGQVYRFSFWSKAINEGGGCIISGPSSANCDFPFSTEWKRYSHVFVMPDRARDYLRVGQWNATGKVYFDDVAVTHLVPLQRMSHALQLGEGEQMAGTTYSFTAPFASGNHARPLEHATAGFNSNRWVLGQNDTVQYRHQIGERVQQSARVHVNVNYHTSGKVVAEATRDGTTWVPVAELAKTGSVDASLPAALFPAKSITVRLRSAAAASGAGDSSPGAFQIDSYGYTAEVDGPPLHIVGATRFVDTDATNPKLPITLTALGDLRPGGANEIDLTLTNPGTAARTVTATVSLQPVVGAPVVGAVNTQTPPGAARVRIPYRLEQAGPYTATVTVKAGTTLIYRARTEFAVPAMFAADYGYTLAGVATREVWWAPGSYKISRERPAPAKRSAAVEISAARNEYEPFQLVVRPQHDLKQVSLSCDGLTGPRGASIEHDHVSICEVAYVTVAQPTDSTGAVGAWPDPLPPLVAPIDLRANENQPFWLTVYVPEGTPPGLYHGAVNLSANGWHQSVPLQLTVRSFTLPRETHVQSAFGFSPDMVRRYHNLTTKNELATVVERYYRNFAEHRITPYDPAWNAPIKVDFGGALWRGGAYDATQPFAGQRSLRVTDDDPKAVVGAFYEARILIRTGQHYILKYAVRTAQPGQEYQVTLNSYDANGAWMSGHNLDITRTGSGAWEQVSVDVSSHFQPGLAFVQLYLRPVPWREDGGGTGTAWFDDLQLIGADGKTLISDGGFENAVAPAQVKVDFAAFDKAMSRALTLYHFTSVRLNLEGMGGGTFQERTTGRIGTYAAGTPEYEALFGSYLRQLQDHLEQKGWLDKAYVYWFDEPDTKDYPFVRAGMERIKKYAPKLSRMLTEEPEPALVGAVDLWCPITNNFDPQRAAERLRAGDRMWWYVCTGPKAPYATLFIDHPATELRTWLWQTWKYGVQGILVWESTYWTSSAAYPDSLQNPWHDPMSWVSGYSTTAGTKAPWGNGDGRFLYPPNRDPATDKTKHLEGPVNSIRFEMLREGIEDYEYFYLLRELVRQAKLKGVKSPAIEAAQQLLQVPAAVTTNLTTFAPEPRPLLAHRDKLAHAIEVLSALVRQ